jgi:Tol biopolymer transport system component
MVFSGDPGGRRRFGQRVFHAEVLVNRTRVVAALAATGCVLVSLLLVPASAPVAAAPGDGPRVAYTDDRDEIYQATFDRQPADPPVAPSEGADGSPGSEEHFPLTDTAPTSNPARVVGTHAVKHTGEMSSSPDTFLSVYVSTRDSDRGDVYEQGFEGPDPRITCDNDAVETHPVPEPGRSGRAVAYASDIDGDWNIYIAWPAQGNTDHVGGTCDNWLGVQVTDDTADDLWPAWTPDRDHLVFSSTRQDPLGDLYEVDATPPDPPFIPAPEGGLTRLTVDRGADTQPTVARIDEPTSEGSRDWIAFTSTRFRSDGSLAVLPLAARETDPTTPTDGLALPAFGSSSLGLRTDQPQSSEPAWGNTSSDPYLAFDSTAEDPYGDVWVGKVALAAAGSDGVAPPEVGDRQPIASFAGVGESSPSWSSGFGGTSGNTGASITYTTRANDADASDVATDGTDGRVLVDRNDGAPFSDRRYFDDAGPSYSPDGAHMVFSDAMVDDPARRLMVSDVDGTNARTLDVGGDPGDTNVDPVWSPLGNQIAFVRYPYLGEGAYDDPRVFVLSLAPDGSVAGVRQVSQDPPRGQAHHDTDPSWSPDGKHLVITRTDGPCCEDPSPQDVGPQLAVSRGGIAYTYPYEAHLVVLDPTGAAPEVDVRNAAPGCPPTRVCGPLRVDGRSPAWSPTGDTIAYSEGGGLRTVALNPAGPTGTDWFATPPKQLTGIGPAGPTVTRDRISWSEDPAWSPDGTRLAFAGQPAGQPDQRDLYTVSAADGTGLTQVTDGRGPQTEPAFSPVLASDVGVSVSIGGSPAALGAPVTATFTVTNHGPARALAVQLTTSFTPGGTATAPSPPPGCQANGSGCTFATMAPGETQTYVVTLTYALPVDGTATGHVSSTSPDPDAGNNDASATYQVLAAPPADVGVKLALDGPTGWVGGQRLATVTVRNAGPAAADSVTLAMTYPVAPPPRPFEATSPEACLDGGPPCTLGTMPPGTTQTFDVPLLMLHEGTGQITATVATTTTDPDPGNDTADVDLDVLQPTIRLLPEVARPGSVTMAYGEKMPPGSKVDLAWVPGITITRGPYKVHKDGTVRAPMVLIRHDRLGDREIEATSRHALFSPVRGPMLVAERLATAPTFLARG